MKDTITSFISNVTDLLLFVLFFFLGVIVAGQLLSSPWTIFTGILFALIISTQDDRWGPFDLLYLRRLVTYLGLSTLIAVQLAGVLFTWGMANLTTVTILSASIGSTPVLMIMIIVVILVTWDHYRHTT